MSGAGDVFPGDAFESPGGLDGADELSERRPQLGDEDALFRKYDPSLRRIVRRIVNTSPDIVDDACNFAWLQFMRHQSSRRGRGDSGL